MDAPTYPPATSYAPPERLARTLDTGNVSIADLKAIPEAWAIVTSEIQGLDMRIGNDMLKPHLGNFSFRDLTQFHIVDPAQLDRIDAKLKTLGEVK